MNRDIVLIRNAQAYDFGGGERFPVLLSSVLKDHQLKPTIISRSTSLRKFASEKNISTIRGWWWSKQNWSGVNTFLFPVYVVWQIVLFFYYLSIFRRIKPLAVHIQSKDDFVAATYAAKAVNARVIWTDHADLKHIWQNNDLWYKNPTGKLVLRAAKHADVVSLVSESEKELVTAHLKKSAPIAEKLIVVYNGAFDQYEENEKSDEIIFIAVSRLVKDKGIGELIDAFISLNNSTSRLWLVGEGNDRPIFEAQAKSHENIIFLGQQSDPVSFLSQSSIFVHPTYHEGFSLALVEASMMKLPIIATAVGGNPEIIIHNKTGLLVRPKDAAELATAMREFAQNTEFAQKLGNNAREQYLNKFEFKTIVEKQFIPLYERSSK